MKLTWRASLCVVTIVALLPAVALASLGIKGGLVEAELFGDGIEALGLTEDDFDKIETKAFAIHIDMPINNYLSLRPEFLYIEKGGMVPAAWSSAYSGPEAKVEMVLTYASVPVVLKLRIPTGLPISPYLFGGGYVAFSQEGEYRFDPVLESDPDTEEIENLRETNFGWIVGGGLKLGSLIAEARYSEGLNTVFLIEDAIEDYEDLEIYNRTISILVGFDFN